MSCFEKSLIPLLLLLLLMTRLEAVSIVDHRADDEYIVDHQVSYENALVEAKDMKIFPGPVPGCKPCSRDEMRYCKNGSVLEDHCCCDGGYNEVFGFVEHTCRVGPEACKVRAADCAEYSRLRECCCHSYLASYWKYLAGGVESAKMSHWLLLLGILTTLIRALR